MKINSNQQILYYGFKFLQNERQKFELGRCSLSGVRSHSLSRFEVKESELLSPPSKLRMEGESGTAVGWPMVYNKGDQKWERIKDLF